jgi:hypothetical protein
MKLMMASARNDSRSAPATSLRPAMPVVIWPGNSAIVLVILASLGSSPARMSAGSVMNEPPPASAFCAPAHSPAASSSAMVVRSSGAVVAESMDAGFAVWRAAWPAILVMMGLGALARGGHKGMQGSGHLARSFDVER